MAVWALMLAFAASAVYGLVWAIHNGQLRGFKAGARSIFDEEEPVGVPTDALVHDPHRQAASPRRGAGQAGRSAAGNGG